MDLVISAVIPAVGSRFVAPRLDFPVSTLEAVLAFLGIYALLKIYRLWLYPTWLSPLRNLPGPKVGAILLIGAACWLTFVYSCRTIPSY